LARAAQGERVTWHLKNKKPPPERGGEKAHIKNTEERMNRTIQQSYYVPGTLTANLGIIFKAHADMTLIHVSGVVDGTTATTLAIGTTATAEAYMVAKTLGQSGVPAEWTKADFVGTQFPRIEKGTAVKLTVVHASGVNPTIVLTFVEG
jgi:hypothetical protein